VTAPTSERGRANEAPIPALAAEARDADAVAADEYTKVLQRIDPDGKKNPP
jgi:hypothetical protein